jgi:ribosomal protein S18 acetylase RimI-like enzyme
MPATVSSAAVRLVPADSIDFDALVRLFNTAYSDYAVPLRLDRAALEFTISVCDIDLAASRVALDDGEPAAFAFLAVRCDEGWIGGMGTVPAHRREGLGEAVLTAALTEARASGAASVRLEVIVENTAALRLYEKLGFRRTRDVVVWLLERRSSLESSARPVAHAEAQAWIAANRPAPEPWQRADETLERVRSRGTGFEGLVAERDGEPVGAALYQPGEELLRVVQIAARDEDAAAELLVAAAGRSKLVRLLNAPADEPASLALERLGARAEIRQHEMVVRL